MDIREETQQEIKRFDALVIGGGAAGLYSALSLYEYLNEAKGHDWKIALVTKDNLTISASDWAQGGIAAVIDKDDSVALHVADTLQAGAGICELDAVEVLVSKAEPQIRRLLEFGVDFDRLQNNSLALTLEAAHSRKRVLHAADATGRELVTTLAKKVIEQPSIEVFDGFLVLDAIMEENRCVGMTCLDLNQDFPTPIELRASVTVLATGGGAQVFAQNTNPAASTGDGVAIAWRAGAKVRDLEFVQFHPTALAIKGAPRFLISEAVRGEGAHLIDHQGDRFAFEYHPMGELAPRDVVSRAVFQHLLKTGEPTVFLDLSPIDRDRIAYRFPNIIKICQKWQIDLFSQPIPVTPAAHYCMGGIITDSWGASSIAGLYAVGESSSTGVHGANRLASNSLLECFVFGARLAQQVSQELLNHPQPLSNLDSTFSLNCSPQPHIDNSNSQNRIGEIRHELQELTWRAAGICRRAEELETAIAQILLFQEELLSLSSNNRLWVETRNLTDFAYLLVKSALFRTESRGAHFRSDFPNLETDWQAHTVIQGKQIERITLKCC